MITRIIKSLLAICFLCNVQIVTAQSFDIVDIELEGLERITPGTVFSHIPVEVGDTFNESDSVLIIRQLYQTELFSDVQIRRDGNKLIVALKERPGIASLEILGNKDIPDEQLIESLEAIGIAPGRVLNRSVLERLENELLQQYFSRGKYSVEIDTVTTELVRNRVDVQIMIAEGEAANIRELNIVGNTAYEEKDLMEDFQSGKKPIWKFWSDQDKYSKQTLAADLEGLRSQYLNTGYMNFDIDSTQVSITPDKKDIFISININEGDQYTLNDVKLAGKFVVPEQELKELLVTEPGGIFSRELVVRSTDAISRRLSSDGYAFSRINPIPKLNEEDKSVDLTFFIDPGKRTYVRRINIVGNQYSRDEVYRRELRQIEGAWFSQTAVDLSRRRIQRLAFVEMVEVETNKIPGVDDFVDITFTLQERLAGSFSVGAGLSDSQGAVLTTSVSQDNFLGSGKQVAFQINTSKVNTIYDVSYTDPYYTIDGVSRGYGFSYIKTDASEADISDFDSEKFSIRTNYGIPLTEDDRVSMILDLQKTDVQLSNSSSDEIREFLDENGEVFLNFSVTGTHIHDSRNRRMFGTKGLYHKSRLEITTPLSDLEYYKLEHKHKWLYPINDIFTFSTRSTIAYGDTYGGESDLPFFEKFRAGGASTVRGYTTNTLGPRDSRNDAYGGNFLTTAGVQLYFPVPSVMDPTRFRLGVFADAGNVFEDVDEFETSELRGSVGLEVNMLTGMGGITFSFSAPVNDDEEDETESFQFEFGTSF